MQGGAGDVHAAMEVALRDCRQQESCPADALRNDDDIDDDEDDDVADFTSDDD